MGRESGGVAQAVPVYFISILLRKGCKAAYPSWQRFIVRPGHSAPLPEIYVAVVPHNMQHGVPSRYNFQQNELQRGCSAAVVRCRATRQRTNDVVGLLEDFLRQ